MLELYHGEPNGAALKALIVLHEKELPFTSRYLDLLETTPFDDVVEVAYNLEREAPILVHQGQPIAETLFMSMYLDDAFPERPLQSGEALDLWSLLVWGRFCGEVLAPAVGTLGSKIHLVPALAKRDRPVLEAAVGSLRTLERRQAWLQALNDTFSDEEIAESRRKAAIAVARIEAALADSDWLAGPTFSLADIEVFAHADALPLLAPEVASPAAAPRLNAWLDRVRARPSVIKARAHSRTGAPQTAFVPGPEHSRWG